MTRSGPAHQPALTVPAARHALAVLRYLAEHPGPVPAASIARALGLPRSSTYQLLQALAEEAFVVHLPEERRYGLGPALYDLGFAYSRQAPLGRLARPLLSRLTQRTGHSTHLVVLHGRDVYYVVEERSARGPHLVTDVGVRLPAHLTASGRAILAALPRAHVRALYPDASAFTRRTDRGPTGLRELRSVLSGVLARGYATEDGEVSAGLASIAAAVLDHNGYPIAAVALTYPRDGDQPDQADQADQADQDSTHDGSGGQVPMRGVEPAAILAAAAELSRRVGARG